MDNSVAVLVAFRYDLVGSTVNSSGGYQAAWGGYLVGWRPIVRSG
jgi:hypothetical protein